MMIPGPTITIGRFLFSGKTKFDDLQLILTIYLLTLI